MAGPPVQGACLRVLTMGRSTCAWPRLSSGGARCPADGVELLLGRRIRTDQRTYEMSRCPDGMGCPPVFPVTHLRDRIGKTNGSCSLGWTSAWEAPVPYSGKVAPPSTTFSPTCAPRALRTGLARGLCPAGHEGRRFTKAVGPRDQRPGAVHTPGALSTAGDTAVGLTRTYAPRRTSESRSYPLRHIPAPASLRYPAGGQPIPLWGRAASGPAAGFPCAQGSQRPPDCRDGHLREGLDPPAGATQCGAGWLVAGPRPEREVVAGASAATRFRERRHRYSGRARGARATARRAAPCSPRATRTP